MSTPEGSDPQPDDADRTFHGSEQAQPVPTDQTPATDQPTEPVQPGQWGDAGQPAPPGDPGTYGQPTQPVQPPPDTYGAPQPGYGAQQPPYGGQQPAHGGQQPAYDAQQPGYGGQQPGYGGQQPAYGAQQPAYGAQQPAYAAGHYGQAPPGPPARKPGARPGFVIASTIMAMIGGATVLFFGVIFGGVGTAVLTFIDVPADFAWAAGAIWVVAGIALVWGALVLIAAIFALLQRNWARWVLIVMGGVSVALFLVPVFLGDVAFLISIMWVAISAGFLLAPDVNRWYAMRNSPDPGGVTG